MVMRGGFTLVEVIVALGLLSVGMLGAAGAGLLAAKLLRDAAAQEEMSARATVLLDSLLADSVHGAGSSRTPRYRIDWTAAGDSAAVTIRAADSALFVLRGIR